MRKIDSDRQRVLDEVCRGVLNKFVGRNINLALMIEAEAAVRDALGRAVDIGDYVLPDGLALDRVEVGPDMRIKVLFKRTAAFVVSRSPPTPKLMNRFEAIAAELDNQKDPR